MHTTTTSTNAPSNRSHLAQPLDDLLDDLVAGGRIPGVSLAVTSSTTLLYAGGSGWADLQRAPSGIGGHALSVVLPHQDRHRHCRDGTGRPRPARPRGARQRLPPDLPHVEARSAPPAVRQLLDHTAGLPNPLPVRWIRPAAQQAPDPATFLARLLAKHGTVKHPIGGQARYSNLGYLVLAEVIAAAAGEPFVDVLRDVVLTPAGMANTGFTHRAGTPTATGYVRVPRPLGVVLKAYLPPGTVGRRSGRHLAFEPFVVDGPGYGGLIGDVIDAARLARLHLADGTIDGHTVLQPATARRMRTISSPGKPVDLGLGWYRKPNTAAGPPHVEHLGAGGGYYNAMRIYPDLDLGLVVMANTTARYDHERTVRPHHPTRIAAMTPILVGPRLTLWLPILTPTKPPAVALRFDGPGLVHSGIHWRAHRGVGAHPRGPRSSVHLVHGATCPSSPGTPADHTPTDSLGTVTTGRPPGPEAAGQLGCPSSSAAAAGPHVTALAGDDAGPGRWSASIGCCGPPAQSLPPTTRGGQHHSDSSSHTTGP